MDEKKWGYMVEQFAHNTFPREMGIELTDCGEGWATVAFTLGPQHLNPLGVAHGGTLFTLADCASGMAARTDGRQHVTLSSSFTYLKSGQLGSRIEGRGVVRRRGRTTSFVEVDVVDDTGALLAVGTFNYFCIDASEKS